MPTEETDRLDAMMRKVSGLLAKADDPACTPEEADSCRNMAERIMVKYKIEQEDLIKRGDLRVNGLDILFKEVNAYHLGNEYSDVYSALMSYAIAHTGCYGVWTGYTNMERVITIVGYEADIRYAEALFTSARLLFADRMEPKVEPSLSDEDNVYRLRSSGMERIRIAKVMGWGDTGSATAKVTRLYKKACEARGEDAALTGRGVSVVDYRLAYAEGFKSEFWSRLYEARIAIEAELDSGGIVLHGRKERIMEEVYKRWPSLRPSTEPAVRSTKPVKYKPPTKAEMRAWEKQHTPAARAGRQAGRKAASEVDVVGQTPKRRLEN
jgi:hypothetical protein